MEWTDLHGAVLARALEKVLGRAEEGAIAFVRCLTPDVVKRLAEDDSFELRHWDVRRVAEDRAPGTISADRAVELREEKGKALVLLVDTERPGAGMDGIYSAAREIVEGRLFREARALAAREVANRRSRSTRQYALDALREAGRRYGARDAAISPWTAFDFLCRVAAGGDTPGAYLHILGLWLVSEAEEGNFQSALSSSRRFVDRLLGPAAAALAPGARIEALRLDGGSEDEKRGLERFLHAVDAKPLLEALNDLTGHPRLWVGALRADGSSQVIKTIELTPWRNRNTGRINRWSGLTEEEGADEPPTLFLSDSGGDDGATLEVRWKSDPEDLQKSAVDYRVAIMTSLGEEVAGQDVSHSARPSGERCRFTDDDFSALPDDSVLPAKVVVSVTGDETVAAQDSEDFVIRFGDAPEPEAGGVGVKVRAFSEGVAELGTREAVSSIANEPELAAGLGNYVTLKTPVQRGRRKSFRVFRPSLLAIVEEDWTNRDGRIGRWIVKVRSSGERAGRPDFVPLVGEGENWERAEKASRRMAERLGTTCGGVAQVYDEHSKVYEAVKYYLRAWLALLKSGAPELALVNTVEVQSLSGVSLGLIVLPAHPVRIAWLSAYDNMVLHTALVQGERPSDIRREVAGVDGAMIPAFLPNPRGGTYVFADTLGFHAAGMVRDDDREPKAAVAMLARALGDNEPPEAAPTVGKESAAVLGNEIVKYIECHDTARLLRIHALRAGDGMTVARALGRVHDRYGPTGGDEVGEEQADGTGPIFTLELYPSAAQHGITGRFIADAREKRRSGAGVLAEEDRWMLESLSLPGGVNLPRLRWARKGTEDPKVAAHLAIAFDTFQSRVDITGADTCSRPRPYHAFGLLSFFERHYSSRPSPRWINAIPPAEGGEKHPSNRAHTDWVTRLTHATHNAVARHLHRDGVPAVVTEISRERAEALDELHRLCDWVVTLDRNAGVEYFDSPRDDRAIYDAYVIDCVPERDDLASLQLITSTTSMDEVRNLLDCALDRMGLSRSRRNAVFLMGHLKALSGRLAIRLTGHRPATSELIALAMSHANCGLAEASDNCWVSLEEGFLIPVDDVRDLLPPLKAAYGDEAEEGQTRPDLIYVTMMPRRGLAFRFIEVKYRRNLRAARALDVLESVRSQTMSLRSRWYQWYSHSDACSTFRALRRAKLARVLRFYADKAQRHTLPTGRHRQLMAEIDRMIERGGDYAFGSIEGGDRGWVFCPEYPGERPLEISPEESGTRIYLFGPGYLPDTDFGPGVRRAEEVEAPRRAVAGERGDQEESRSGTEEGSGREGGAGESKRGDEEEIEESGGDADTERREPVVSLGIDPSTNSSVRWSLTVRGNPHLLVAGLPGMGKTTFLLNLCRQMAEMEVRPIVFSYHEDIDERLVTAVEGVRFIDFADGLGFHPLQVVQGGSRLAHLDVAGEMRDLFMAIYPELGDIQGERLRNAVKDSFVEAGWGTQGVIEGAPEPPFVRFVEILRSQPRPDSGLKTLLARLNELDDYGFFRVREGHRSLWDDEQPTVIRIHTTINENLQRALASLVFYGLYKDMFRRGVKDRITHALIFDEAHRAARLRLIPTMAKECRKYGISLVLASQEARDFNVSVFSAIANYLVLRLTETDARFLVKNVSSSQQERALVDRIKQMERFKGLFFAEGKSKPHLLNLAD